MQLLFRRTAVVAIVIVAAFPAGVVAQAPEAFEVASVKPMGDAPGEALAAFGGGCDGSFPRVENNRFTVTTTMYALMTWAYGFNRNGGCSFVSNGNFITGGPGWVRSERFEIQAVMREGSPVYSVGQFLNGEAPRLEAMLKTLLIDRFKLAVHRETKDAPVYALVVARDGPRVPLAKENERTNFGVRRQRDASGQLADHLVVAKTTMTYVALLAGLITGRPVVDRTGLSGEFTFDLPFAPRDAKPGDTSAPSIFTALQEQLGLRLEDTRAPVEVLVIDSAERPSAN